jgi:hypothetical protein
MGFQSAANAQAQGTNQAMLYQAAAAQQQQQALQQAQQQAAQALQQGQTQGAGALQAGQTGALGGLENYYGQGVGFQQPYMTAGGGAVNQLAALFGQGGAYTQQPTLQELQMDPGYAFRLQQGQQAMTNAARAGGLAGSGAALKAATRYGQEAGSQEYQNAYNRFMANRAAATQGLTGLAGLGAGAAQTATGLAGTTGANIGNVYTGTGQNLANLYGNTAANLASTYTGTGNQLANVYGGLGQGLGQGAANIGSAYANAAMGPTNLLAALAGQGLQAGATYLGMMNRPPSTPNPMIQR